MNFLDVDGKHMHKIFVSLGIPLVPACRYNYTQGVAQAAAIVHRYPATAEFMPKDMRKMVRAVPSHTTECEQCADWYAHYIKVLEMS